MKNYYHRIGLFAILALLTGVPMLAQSDVTKYFLTNYGFDENFDYTAGTKVTVTQEVKEIDGWIPNLSADYTITGVYEFGFSGTFNGASVPAKNYHDVAEGGGLALSTGWEQVYCYYQTVTLPAGAYTIYAPTYNGKTVAAGTSKLAWIPTSGTSTSSTLTRYPIKRWTVDSISFTLTKQTTGKVQIGYKAAAGGSSNSANIIIDYVQIMAKDMTVSKTELKSNLSKAKNLYDTGTGIAADSLKRAIDTAQAVYDNEESTMPDVLEANWQLKHTIEYYSVLNASEDNPVDRTSYISNPSFETNGTTGWEVNNMSIQSNSVFSRKNGTYYMESWVSAGNKIADASVKQTLKNIPAGRYKLTANALHIQQTGSNSTTNKGQAQTGAYLYAGIMQTTVTSMKQYEVIFPVIDDKSDVTIGLKAEDPTGNYLCTDYFRLQYIGAITATDYASEIQMLILQGQQLLSKGIQETVADSLNAAITLGTEALQGTGTDEAGNFIYDIEALKEARTLLKRFLEAAQISRSHYEALQTRIDYAEKVIGWWVSDSVKITAVDALKAGVEAAKKSMTDYTLTVTQINDAATKLNKEISAVDKKIYCSGNACGTDAQLKIPTNNWCYDRSMQSKHWILFWEPGYGANTPDAVESILNTADKVFELYANKLEFITINQGKSKTDTYKMIIRLRYTEEWEASGSGIDNVIGLLTLSRWAYTSREGQTVAHEIGHCFQYQTHCDNNDWNGWMYNWGKGNYNVFWEMCAQWQAYKYYPSMQFNNEWLDNTLNGLHKHPLSVDQRYNNYFIQDYFCHKHGIGFIGRLWNESKNPEDPLQAYMRLTMPSSISSTEKLSQLNDEMWEYGARMTTFDLDPIRQWGSSTINRRQQTALTKDSEGFWSPTVANCIENFGHNAIRLNVPQTGKTVYAEFIGEAGKTGYTTYNKTKAGWRYGFVALKKDGTRVYGDIATATYNNPDGVIEFECPSNCSYLWLVVSGAPTSYWTRDWIDWDGTQGVKEQWPYKVKFYQTNVLGNTNNNTYPTDIEPAETIGNTLETNKNVYSITGHVIRKGSTSLDGLPAGIYIVNGRKIIK